MSCITPLVSYDIKVEALILGVITASRALLTDRKGEIEVVATPPAEALNIV
jgi:hypothetical protein